MAFKESFKDAELASFAVERERLKLEREKLAIEKE